MSASLEELPVKTPLKRILAFWDTALLGLVMLAMLGMTGYLLWPEPAATLKLISTPITPVVSEITLETTKSESDMRLQESKKVRQRISPKKPKKQPILNLNTANLQQFQLLPGIGPKMAERIIEYRKVKGPFQSTEQIMDVKGIGSKKFEKLKPFIKL